MKRLLFTIWIKIPEDKLDNPAPFTTEGVQMKTSKSAVATSSMDRYKDRLIERQREYAESIGADYVVVDGTMFKDFADKLTTKYPFLSMYDVINFYKHHMMYAASFTHDQICYMDLDVVPNTTSSIFEAFDIMNKFVVPDSNAEAKWGKTVSPKWYNTCIRNPATKYWNAHAVLSELGLEPDRDVYNTGIMLASADIIRRMDYMTALDEVMEHLTFVKHDPDSMYPSNIQRVFNYDNETVFSIVAALKQIPIQLMGDDWHQAIRNGDYDENAKMFHVIDKAFGRFFV